MVLHLTETLVVLTKVVTLLVLCPDHWYRPSSRPFVFICWSALKARYGILVNYAYFALSRYMKFIVEINIGVGPFYFGHSIEEYKSKNTFTYTANDAEIRWDKYEFFGDTIEIYVDKLDSKIEAIACRDNCYLNDLDLIGLDIDDFFLTNNFDKSESDFELISLTDDAEEDQGVYDIDRTGLQVWVNSLNKIVTVFLSDE